MAKTSKRTRPRSKTIRRESDGEWEWFSRGDEARYDITGKYLFFSPQREVLVRIAIEELQSGTFQEAKIRMPDHNIGPDYVLCLYHRDDSLKDDLAAKYRGRRDVRYRYWKSDEATLRGQYSSEFLQNLPHTFRVAFRRPKKGSDA